MGKTSIATKQATDVTVDSASELGIHFNFPNTLQEASARLAQARQYPQSLTDETNTLEYWTAWAAHENALSAVTGSVLMRASAFVSWAMREGPWEGGSIDGGDLQDKAEALGLIVKTAYDPAIHGENDCGAEPGDEWFVLHPEIVAASKAVSVPEAST